MLCTLQIMEYAPNGDLCAYLSRQVHPLTWGAKRQLCADVARGLEFLHARTPQPVVHGDLKVRELLPFVVEESKYIVSFEGHSLLKKTTAKILFDLKLGLLRLFAHMAVVECSGRCRSRGQAVRLWHARRQAGPAKGARDQVCTSTAVVGARAGAGASASVSMLIVLYA